MQSGEFKACPGVLFSLPKEMIEFAKKCPEHLGAAFISKHL